MKKVIRFESDDGEFFNTAAECEKHEWEVYLLNKIDSDLYLRDINAEDILKWVTDNFDDILKLKDFNRHLAFIKGQAEEDT